MSRKNRLLDSRKFSLISTLYNSKNIWPSPIYRSFIGKLKWRRHLGHQIPLYIWRLIRTFFSIVLWKDDQVKNTHSTLDIWGKLEKDRPSWFITTRCIYDSVEILIVLLTLFMIYIRFTCVRELNWLMSFYRSHEQDTILGGIVVFLLVPNVTVPMNGWLLVVFIYFFFASIGWAFSKHVTHTHIYIYLMLTHGSG